MKFGLLFAYQIPPESGIPWHEPYQDMLRCLPRAEELTIALQPHRPVSEGDDDAAAYVEAES